MSYMEMIFIDSDDQARKTGVTAQFDTPLQTWAAFKSARSLAVPLKDAEFILDYYNRAGDLADSIGLSRAGFERISGERAKTETEYRRLDAEFWGDLRDKLPVPSREGKKAFAKLAAKAKTMSAAPQPEKG